jgi:PAS domain S-box-containing protein
MAYFSPRFYSMLGYDDGEFPATFDSWLRLVHPEDIDRVEEGVRSSTRSVKGFAIDLRMKKKKGEWLWVSARGKPMESDPSGQVLRVVGTLSDITERKRGEEENARLEARLQQAQKMESVGRLAGGVAHDFNNMLGVILGHATMALEQTPSGDPIHEDLTEIKIAAERSAALTQQLLAFARKQPIAPKVLNLNETVDGILKMLRRLIGENIHFSFCPGSDLWPVKVDPAQIDQILANLCVNAMDAISNTGKIIIETGNRTIDEAYSSSDEGVKAGEYVRLAVIDTGRGMDQETMDHAFEPFFTTKEIGKGTGLGLATVYGAVKQNNGFVHLNSRHGQGTAFEIFFPRSKEKNRQICASSSVESTLCGNETILLVEDEPAILKITKMILKKQGYTVFAVNNPGEALRLARDHADTIHLIITDVVMPEMNGRDLVNSLMPFNPNLKHLFMSGYTADVIAHQGVLEPGVHFIEKPFSSKELAYKVREVLGR